MGANYQGILCHASQKTILGLVRKFYPTKPTTMKTKISPSVPGQSKAIKEPNTTQLAILVFLLSAFPTHQFAQYGWIRNSHQTSFILSSAKVTTINMAGYLTSGYNSNAATNNGDDFIIQHADDVTLDLTPAGTLGESYQIWDDVNNCSNSMRRYGCRGVYVIETTNQGATGTEAYALTGIYDEGIFFATLNSSGNPILTHRWKFLGTTQGYILPPMIIESSTAGDYYICGTAAFKAYVMKIKYDGTVYWAKEFDNGIWMEARALIESPYNSNELVVVGRFDDNTPGGTLQAEAFFMKLNATNGSLISLDLYGWNTTTHSDQWFTSIAPAQSTYGNSAGYILGGFSHTSMGCTCDDWMIKLDPAGNVIWSTLITPLGGGSNFGINDVFERYNPNGEMYDYEYYGVSAGENAATSSRDTIIVWRLDETGSDTWVAPNEFTYPIGDGIGNTQFSTQIECVGDGSNAGDGFGAWSTDLSTNEHFFYKNYFGGANSCEGKFKNMQIQNGPGKTISPSLSDVDFNVDCQNFSLVQNTDQASVSCWTLNIQGASRRANLTSQNDQNFTNTGLSLYPNPTAGHISVLFNNTKTDSIITLEITNILGQRIYSQTVGALPLTNFQHTIDLSELNIQSGTYYLISKTKDGEICKKFMYLQD